VSVKPVRLWSKAAGVQVDVSPFQPQELTLPQPHRDGVVLVRPRDVDLRTRAGQLPDEPERPGFQFQFAAAPARKAQERRRDEGDGENRDHPSHGAHQRLRELFHLEEPFLPREGAEVDAALPAVSAHREGRPEVDARIPEPVPASPEHQEKVPQEEPERGRDDETGAAPRRLRLEREFSAKK